MSMTLLQRSVSKQILDHMGFFVSSAKIQSKLNKSNKAAKMLVVQRGCLGSASADQVARVLKLSHAFEVRKRSHCRL